VAAVIKYLGSKRRLVPALAEICARSGARSAIDLFTGTTRVAQAFKGLGVHVTAVDSAAYAHVFARCYVATDAGAVDRLALRAELARLDALPGCDGYVTETFCRRSRFLRPENGRRIDAIRAAIAAEHAGSALEPVLLTSLIEAADRVDSTTGVQMAYLKAWAPRAHGRLALREPELLPGPGAAVHGDAVALAATLPEADLAYLDPPYNQHSYRGNYHVWETLALGDAPAHYGVACKRADCRDPARRSPFNSKPRFRDALAAVVAAVPARLVVLSYSDEAWLPLDDLVALCAPRGDVAVLAFDSARYVGARIGIHDPAGRRVGQVGRLRNVEYVVVAGAPADVARATGQWRSAAAAA
jgi:adenine-specific DNA-methyltransferase